MIYISLHILEDSALETFLFRERYFTKHISKRMLWLLNKAHFEKRCDSSKLASHGKAIVSLLRDVLYRELWADACLQRAPKPGQPHLLLVATATQLFAQLRTSRVRDRPRTTSSVGKVSTTQRGSVAHHRNSSLRALSVCLVGKRERERERERHAEPSFREILGRVRRSTHSLIWNISANYGRRKDPSPSLKRCRF